MWPLPSAPGPAPASLRTGGNDTPGARVACPDVTSTPASIVHRADSMDAS